MTHQAQPAELSAEDLDAAVGGDLDTPVIQQYDLATLKKAGPPEPRPGIIAIL